MVVERTLKTRDIVLFNVAAIVGMRWVALAAANGPSSLFLWVLAALVFFVPQAFYARALRRRVETQGDASVDRFLGLLHRWKAAQFPDTEELCAENPITNYSERTLLNWVRP